MKNNVEETIKQYDRYIRVVATRLDNNNEYWYDYYTIGQYSIVKALEKYDDSKGDLHKFITWFIKRDMLEFKYSKTNVIKIPHKFQFGPEKIDKPIKAISINTPIGGETGTETLEDLIGEDDEQFNDILDDKDESIRRRLKEEISKMNPQYQKIILLKYIQDMNFREIGEELGTTKENIRQQYEKIIKILRKKLTQL